MLTWSNWHAEPRSNRHHYATRFARHLPVLFVQPDAEDDAISTESVPGHSIELLHVPRVYDLDHARMLERALAQRGIRHPLLWIYNPYFADFVARSPARLRIYHATEDYVSPPESIVLAAPEVTVQVKAMLRLCDLLIAVSDGVADGYRRYTSYDGDLIVLPNGCDFDFWATSGASDYRAPANGRPVAFYQGGINTRLDFRLLTNLVNYLPDWDFWFCGALTDATHSCGDLLARPNVRYFGMLDSTHVAELARQARIGLMPFKQEGWIHRSLPLKAYEYVACGLPVVTIPIEALAVHGDLFHTATDSAGFVRAMQSLAPSRDDPTAVERRLAIARAQSYDLRFQRLTEVITAKLASPPLGRPRLNVLMLYDKHSIHVRTIKEHLDAFANYSHHRYHFLSATGSISGIDDTQIKSDLGPYDAIVIHYSVRVSMDEHISPGVADLVTAYPGPKLLFIQDEYDNTEAARRWIERLGIDAVFTNIPLDQVEKVYPRARFPRVDFLPTLTGYVPEDPILERYIMPLSERKVIIGYRARRLPHQYGQLGQEKYDIGIEVKRLAEAAGLPVDIEVDNSKRIYSTDWYRFLGSCRATLGTESGANIFDEDGSLAELAKSHSDMPYSDFAAAYLGERDGAIRMNQISPKIFEAIRLRTALILFEGSYSGVVWPDCHFIPLKKDFSNIGEVFAKVTDLRYIEELTTRAYNEIVATGKHSYAAFVDGIDRYLEKRNPRPARAVILSAPVLQRLGHWSGFRPFAPISALLVDGAIDAPIDATPSIRRHRLAPRFRKLVASLPSALWLLRPLWRLIPYRVRHGIASRIF